MLDIKWIRENPAALDAALKKRGAEPSLQALVALDEARRSHVGAVQALQERRNAASKEIGKAMAAKDQAAADSAEGRGGEAQGRTSGGRGQGARARRSAQARTVGVAKHSAR
jgi:seryl-tRNA synthetase